MLVVSDIDDVFLPKPTDLLVNLAEARASLETLLGRINDMFQENSILGSAMGPALQAGFKLMVGFAWVDADCAQLCFIVVAYRG
jgi:protein transport protein SEC24